ncbi:MerR family transcriptional regulator [Pseudogemmobacter sp. W21_MBD1_M6]|uniref:MerR family transcriptional regulator n=1 Tax=Pseudogemmobacter sp. W21_MBD1_M6 TaxID=3240271 RepID=UPI003F9606F8
MDKSRDAFRTISEVAEWLDSPAHVLRFWESKFPQIKPVKRAGGRRYYRPADMLLLGGIKKLLHDDGLTIKGVQKILRDEGVKHVLDMAPPIDTIIAAEYEAEPALDAPLAAPPLPEVVAKAPQAPEAIPGDNVVPLAPLAARRPDFLPEPVTPDDPFPEAAFEDDPEIPAEMPGSTTDDVAEPEFFSAPEPAAPSPPRPAIRADVPADPAPDVGIATAPSRIAPLRRLTSADVRAKHADFARITAQLDAIAKRMEQASGPRPRN